MNDAVIWQLSLDYATAMADKQVFIWHWLPLENDWMPSLGLQWKAISSQRIIEIAPLLLIFQSSFTGPKSSSINNLSSLNINKTPRVLYSLWYRVNKLRLFSRKFWKIDLIYNDLVMIRGSRLHTFNLNTFINLCLQSLGWIRKK